MMWWGHWVNFQTNTHMWINGNSKKERDVLREYQAWTRAGADCCRYEPSTQFFISIHVNRGDELLVLTKVESLGLQSGRCHKVRLYIINFRNRCLTLENLDTLSAFMPALQCRLTGQPDLPLPLIANVRTNCLRSPFTYKDEDVENATCCSLVEKPAQVMMTPAGFR